MGDIGPSKNLLNSSSCELQSNITQLSPGFGEFMKSKAAGTPTKNFTRVEKIVSNESSVQKRVSPRFQNTSDSKRAVDDSSLNKSVDIPKYKVGQKRAKVDHSEQEMLHNVKRKKAEEKDCGSDPVVCSDIRNAGFRVKERRGLISGCSPSNISGKSAHARVKRTLRIFNKEYLRFVQEEEKRCAKPIVKGSKSKDAKKIAKDTKSKEEEKRCVKPIVNGSKSKDAKKIAKDTKSKKGVAARDDGKRSSRRPDLKTITKMKKQNETLYDEKRFGHLPGVDVGHKFLSRAEMVVVGLHGHWLCGIDYMGGTTYSKLKKYKKYSFPLAISIVLSGQYEDNVDDSEEIVYTGQGGNDLLGNKRQVKDQVLTRGNLALKNSMEQSVPIRVIRGHDSADSYCKRVYTYDGLYKVVKYWTQKGASGFTVFKFRLKRLGGQPTLTTDQVHFAGGRASEVPSESRGLICNDICQGQENICIPATNLFDDPPVAPAGFTYLKSVHVSESIKLPPNAPGCKCKGKCTNPRSCSCARLNGPDFPYVSKDGGRLIEAKDVVFECGPNCGCGPECVNRTSQKGLKYQLEVFRTKNKGWAVRSLDPIPSGAPVCEYTGVLRRTDELDHVSENDYIFEIDCWQTINGIGGRERRLCNVSVPTSDEIDGDKTSAPEFCIDAGSIGNVARFVNHSCEPNLFVQCVLSSHRDLRLARVVLFASDNIPPLEELTYDYGYALDSVVGPDGKIKQLACHCGALECRKRLY